VNWNPDPDAPRAKKRFRLPERIKQQNEEIFRRKLDRALPKTRRIKKSEEPEPSLLKLALVWAALLGIAWLLIRFGIRPPR
jgi:hypothetical protein